MWFPASDLLQTGYFLPAVPVRVLQEVFAPEVHRRTAPEPQPFLLR